MTLRVLAWNSQGNKGDTMWADLAAMGTAGAKVPGPNILPGHVAGAGNATDSDDLLIFVSEAGTPPWMLPVDYAWGHEYSYQYGASHAGANWFNRAPAAGGLAAAVGAWGTRGRPGDAAWVPWQRTIGGAPALRCSVALYWFPGKRSTLNCHFGRRALIDDGDRRPLLTATLTRGNAVQAALLFAHLPANHYTASQVLPELATQASQIIGEGVPRLVAGDLNINALKAGAMAAVPKGWGALRTGVPTQNGGGELDWGIQSARLAGHHPSILWAQSNVAAPACSAPSDHAALLYDLAV